MRRGSPRKAFVCTFGLVAGPSKIPLTAAEKESSSTVLGGSKDVQEVGKWDVLVRREVAGKPVTVFDVRYVAQTVMRIDFAVRMVNCYRTVVQIYPWEYLTRLLWL